MVMGFRFLVLIGLVVMTGCEEKASSKTPPRPQQWGGGTGSYSWVQLQKLNPQATLEAAKASVGSIFDADQKKHVVYVILADFDGSSHSKNTAKDAWTREYVGSLKNHDGRSIEWRCEAKVPPTGEIRINDKTYDFKKGRLFLVSSRGSELVVRQIERKIDPQKEKESLEKLMETDPVFGAFLAGKELPERSAP